MTPAYYCLIGIGVLIYAAFLWAGGKANGGNLLSPRSDLSLGRNEDFDKDQDPVEFYFTFWLWVAAGLGAIGYGFYLKFFGGSGGI